MKFWSCWLCGPTLPVILPWPPYTQDHVQAEKPEGYRYGPTEAAIPASLHQNAVPHLIDASACIALH
eukprot:8002550-Karenia_brevis.AAC.1